MPIFTRKQMEQAHAVVHAKLAWLPEYASQDEIISALRQLADKLQAQVTQLKIEGGTAAERPTYEQGVRDALEVVRTETEPVGLMPVSVHEHNALIAESLDMSEVEVAVRVSCRATKTSIEKRILALLPPAPASDDAREG